MRRLLLFLLFVPTALLAQWQVSGVVKNGSEVVAGATVLVRSVKLQAATDSGGKFQLLLPAGKHRLEVLHPAYETLYRDIIAERQSAFLHLELHASSGELSEVVITGTMKEVSRTASPVPVEVYTPRFFQKAASVNLFEAVGLVNGVQPQLNCNICNTGDIHINGMEGPYTQVLIDGMPIVSGLATVYGLMGIPLSMIERVEIIKGPAAALYGSEAMGGTINIITKTPAKAPLWAADLQYSSWHELNLDAGVKLSKGKWSGIMGMNYFRYLDPRDNNADGFADVTLQHRGSLFTKWSKQRKDNRILQAGARLFYEDRWGGEMNWQKDFRGGDSIYGESIYTKRMELFGTYEMPWREKVILNWSATLHDQHSYYGTTPYMAQQHIGFLQLHWQKQVSHRHNLLAGLAQRYTHYNDNTPATPLADKIYLPGLFVQDEWNLGGSSTLLSGLRVDHHKAHGLVWSPRLAFKTQAAPAHVIRMSAGTGFRVVNLFTEDHAALTGAREVVIAEALKPERSFNAVLNWQWNIRNSAGSGSIETGLFYSHFFNKILPDYDTDPNKIIYQNLAGYGVGRGASLQFDWLYAHTYKFNLGVTYMDVFQQRDDGTGKLVRQQQVHSPRWSGTFAISKTFPRPYLVLDLTGTWFGPMRLPILPNDFRPEYSPWFCLANLQLTKKTIKGFEFYGGIKNIFNFLPSNPIMRPEDPFDRQVDDPVNNPNGYTFDPSYNFAPLQGRRTYIGIRFTIR